MAGSGEYYTCSMDPQVHENVPGNCPICHMNMIKVKKNELKKGQIKLSTEQILLAGIQWDTLRENNISKEILLTGKVAVNQTLAEAVSSKVKGRIDSLNVKNVGDYIHKGERLYQIYSEDMNSAQQEYLLAIGKEKLTGGDKNMLSQFKSAAKNKLLLFGMSEAQIVDLESKGKVMNRISIYAQTDGFVSDIFIAEGNYVESGTMLFHLSSLQSLWVEAEAYLSYLTYLKIGTDGVFSIPAAGEKTYNGKIIFIAPQVQSPERFVLARFEISNPTEKIKPGMMATITLQTGKKKALTLPLDAVIQDSKGATVWVRNPEGVFEIRMVKTGLQNSREIEVTEGLLEGDVVVTRGSYLLNSEYIFKNGANPMEGMDMKKKETMPGMNM
jgi:Cu(I)/Ag(I) efflux system membrane fusion protein